MVAANSLNISETGFQSFDGVSVFKGRTLQAGTGISITNANGVAGNPVITATGSPAAATTMLSVSMTVSQSIAQNTLTNIVYDNVLSDTAGGYAAGLYTVPTTGMWLLEMNANLQSTAGFINGDCFITVNPANYLTHGTSTATVSDPNTAVLSTGILHPLNAGDVICVKVFAQTVGATNFDAIGYANGFYNNFRAILQ